MRKFTGEIDTFKFGSNLDLATGEYESTIEISLADITILLYDAEVDLVDKNGSSINDDLEDIKILISEHLNDGDTIIEWEDDFFEMNVGGTMGERRVFFTASKHSIIGAREENE